MAASERSKKFREELDGLIRTGELLHRAIRYECDPKEYTRQLTKSLDGNSDEVNKRIEALPSFRQTYQAWYSEAQAVVRQVLPDRISDFISYFDVPKGRKEIDFQNYMVRDYLQGLQIQRGGEIVLDGSAAIPEFYQQLCIVKAARDTLDSALLDLKSVLQADLFDSEIESAGALAKAGYLRASGAICGVVLEKHLHHVCDIHNIRVAKKNPGISELIQLLKDSKVITVAQWRFIQSLADTRNVCDHAKGREPTKQEIADLLEGTEKTLKTVF